MTVTAGGAGAVTVTARGAGAVIVAAGGAGAVTVVGIQLEAGAVETIVTDAVLGLWLTVETKVVEAVLGFWLTVVVAAVVWVTLTVVADETCLLYTSPSPRD